MTTTNHDNGDTTPKTPQRPSVWQKGAVATAVGVGSLMSSTALAQQYSVPERQRSHTAHAQQQQQRQQQSYNQQGKSVWDPIGPGVMKDPCCTIPVIAGGVVVAGAIMGRRKPEEELEEHAGNVMDGAGEDYWRRHNEDVVKRAQGHDGSGSGNSRE
jgi:ElaB/YqjD/DUF883 family membrane-anchored ribosome-binding protein